MTLIPNWRESWRMFSVQALIVIGALQGVVLAIPPEALAAPALGTGFTWAEVNTALTVAAAVAGAIGRIVAQPAVSGEQ